MRAVVRILSFAGLLGCSILPKAPPHTFYDLEYQSAPVQCARTYSSPLEMWEFSAAPPYDRAEMVVTQGREVSVSQEHVWVDRSGALVSARLLKDLNAGHLFPLAVPARDAQGAALQLTGYLYRFAWEREGGSARASLQAEVVLRSTEDPARILLHKRYEVTSDPVASVDDAAAFARAMSGVVSRFSFLLRQDLCQVAPEPPAVGSSP